MEGPIQERDRRYLRSIEKEMLNELCSRILKRACETASGEEESPHQRYVKLYRYIQESDDIVAECYDDWRRSTISHRILSLRHHRLLTEEHAKHFSKSAQAWLRMVEESLQY